MNWRRAAMILGLVAVLGLCANAYGRQLTPTATRADAWFEDPKGDAGAAPDVQSVFAYPDPTSFEIGFDFWSKPPTNGAITLWIDSDANPSTGNAQLKGFDYRLEVDVARSTSTFAHWSGTAWASARGGYVNRYKDYLYLGVEKVDLAGPGDNIHFGVSTSASAGGSGPGDLAPDTGWWSESFAPTKLTSEALKVGSVRAGGTLTVSEQVRRSDTQALVSSSDGNVSCSATIGGRELRLVKSAISSGSADSTARCVFATTTKMKGKTVNGQIAVIVKEAFVITKYRVRVK